MRMRKFVASIQPASMDPRLFILTQIHEACRQMTLHDDYGSPSWSDGQFFRGCAIRLERDDASAWPEFLQRLDSDTDLTFGVRSILIDLFLLLQEPDTNGIQLNLPSKVTPLSEAEEKSFLGVLNLWDRHLKMFPHPLARYAPDKPFLYRTEDAKKFIPPSRPSDGEIMYIEMKPGLAGPARIGRVQFSKTRKTIYYDGNKLQSLKGSGYKANYYNVETAMRYWVSNCRKDGNDTLYPGMVEIDDDVREEYWTEVRRLPENKHLTKFRSLGKYSKRRPS